MKHYGLIGEHLGHSLSVPIHETLFRELGISADYLLFPIPARQLPAELPRLLSELDGMNVTIPYKRDVIPFLSGLDPLAERVGAVNTITGGAAPRGYNTDVKGFSDMLRLAGIPVRGLNCLILGTGGASLAVRTALEEMGAASVTFVSRSPRPGQLSYDDLKKQRGDVLVNCTPVGMFPHTDACPIEADTLAGFLKSARGIADLIYNPRETLLTKAARKAGIPCCTGLTMLIAQALEAEAIWQGQPMPETLIPILEEALSSCAANEPS